MPAKPTTVISFKGLSLEIISTFCMFSKKVLVSTKKYKCEPLLFFLKLALKAEKIVFF